MARKAKVFIPKPLPTCCGKNRYPTREIALQYAEEQMMLRTDLTLTVYACICGCGDWHLSRSTTR